MFSKYSNWQILFQITSNEVILKSILSIGDNIILLSFIYFLMTTSQLPITLMVGIFWLCVSVLLTFWVGGWGLLIWFRFLNNYPRSWSIICPPTLQPNVPICKISTLFKAIVIQIIFRWAGTMLNPAINLWGIIFFHWLIISLYWC